MRDIICSSCELFSAPGVTESISETEPYGVFFFLSPIFSGLDLWLSMSDFFCRRKYCRHEKNTTEMGSV